MTLFDRVGGAPAVDALVDEFYARMLADPDLMSWFTGVDVGRLKEHQRAFIAVGLGGPEYYEGRSMREAHGGLSVDTIAYSRTVDHLRESLTALGVEDPLRSQIVSQIERLRPMIVGA